LDAARAGDRLLSRPLLHRLSCLLLPCSHLCLVFVLRHEACLLLEYALVLCLELRKLLASLLLCLLLGLPLCLCTSSLLRLHPCFPLRLFACPPRCLFTLLACLLLRLCLRLLVPSLLRPLRVCHVVRQSPELLQLHSCPVHGCGRTGSGGSSLRGCRLGNERVRKFGVETKKLVCSYRSPFHTQTMDSGLRIVLNDHTVASWVWPLRGGYCQDHVQLWTLIRLLWSHCSTVAQLRSSAHHSSPGCAHTLLLSATLCIRLNPVITTLPCLPCCTVSSPCSIYIFYLVVFSPDLTYFRRT